jgi:hypothetical protein
MVEGVSDDNSYLQSIAEMRERIKILHKEIDILNNETVCLCIALLSTVVAPPGVQASKERALAKQKAAQATAVAQRDGTADFDFGYVVLISPGAGLQRC